MRSAAGGDEGPFYLASQSDTPSVASNVITFSSLDLGTPDDGRLIWACYGGNLEGTLSRFEVSMSIAGVPATLLRAEVSDNNDQLVGIWVASVPTGSTGNVVLTWTNPARTPTASAISLYAGVGFSATPTDTAAENRGSPLNLGLSSVTAGGVNLCIYGNDGATTPNGTLSTQFNTIVSTTNDVLSGYDYPTTVLLDEITVTHLSGTASAVAVAAAIPPI